MKWKKENILKAVMTSLIGLALIAFGGFLLYKCIDAQGWEHIATLIGEAISLMGTGLYLLGIDDPRLPRKPRGGAAIVLLFSMLSLSSCVTWQKCADKFGTGGTHSITVRDTLTVRDTVLIQEDVTEGTVPCEELAKSEKGDTIIYVSDTRRQEIVFWKDQYNQIKYRSKIVQDTVFIEKQIPVEVKGDCPDAVIVDPEKGLSRREKLWRKFQFFSAWLVLAEVLLVGVYVALKRR